MKKIKSILLAILVAAMTCAATIGFAIGVRNYFMGFVCVVMSIFVGVISYLSNMDYI